MRDRWYIGLAATLHDPAIAIVDPEGRVVFAEGAERRLQNKRAYNCPPDDMIQVVEQVTTWCPNDAELVVALNWSEGQFARLEQLVSGPRRHRDATPVSREDAYAWPFPRAGALGTALRNSISTAGLNVMTSVQLTQPSTLRGYDHHLCHAAHAAYSSPFDTCVVAVVDAFGEAGSTSCFQYQRDAATPLARVISPAAEKSPTVDASLGFFYAQLCALCGFDPVKGEEWKVMGLAGYGAHDDAVYRLMRPLIDVHDLALVPGCSLPEQCNFLQQLRAEGELRGATARARADLAHTGQQVFEETMTRLLGNLRAAIPVPALALVGGCALNSSYNGRILSATGFEALHVPSAPADDGTAIGAALLAWQEDHPGIAPPRADSPYLGSRISPLALDHLTRHGRLPTTIMDERELPRRVASLLAEGRVIGWIQGAAEFGPRALGNRSVLADPRPPGMKDHLNASVKYREEFRPFAPAVLDERGDEWFDDYQRSPYMERTLRFRPDVRSRVPAVVHVDGTGRAQSVCRESNPRLHALLAAFDDRTGTPLLLNTSLNVMGRPIVHSLEDALGMFLTTGLDALVVEDRLILKPEAA